MQSVFRFKQFDLKHGGSGMKLTTDSLLLGAWTEPYADVHTVIDAGSGCGVLALMCAQKFPEADIIGIDNSPDAYAESLENFSASPWSDRLHAVLADINLEISETNYSADLIICNPPYFTETLRSPDSSRAKARHAGALSAESIIKIAGRILTPNGTLAIVIPYSHIQRLVLPASIAGLHIYREAHIVARQNSKPSLALLQYSKNTPSVNPSLSTIEIYDIQGHYSSTYRQLTIPFLLHDKKA